MSPRQNWDSPNPSLASEWASSPQSRGGGAHSPAGEGLGASQFRRLEKKLSTLPILCGPEHGEWSFYLITYILYPSLSLSSSLSVSMSLFSVDLIYLLYFLYFLQLCLTSLRSLSLSKESLAFYLSFSSLFPLFFFSWFYFLTFFCISSLLPLSHVQHPFIFLSILNFALHIKHYFNCLYQH